MKRLFSILLSSLFFATSVWAVSTTGSAALNQMNPYTFQMQRVYSDEATITFKYSLNATAEYIDILVDINRDREFDDSEVVYQITDPTKLTRSSVGGEMIQYEVSIPLTTFSSRLEKNVDYHWAMRANRKAYSTSTHAYPNDWGRMVYNMPKGLVVDNNPESAYFGNIYTTESQACTSSDGIGNTLAGGNKTNYAKGEGVYAYYPTLDQYEFPTNHTCYKGGVTWGTTNDEYAPFRLSVAPDGMVFVNDNRRKEDGVTAAIYRMDPAKLNTDVKFDKILYPGGLTGCKTDPHPRAISMAVLNDGNTQKLYVLNAYRRSYVNGSYSYHPHLHRWTLNGTDIGKQEKEWVVCKNTTDNVESVLSYGGKTYEIVNQTTTMVPGVNNDLWIAQRRVTPDANACLLHVKIDGNDLICDYVIVVNAAGKESIHAELLKINGEGACPKAAMALSADGSMLALASSGWINVMDVAYDQNGTPTLTRNDSKSFELKTTAANPVICNALAFDRANNLYAMSETTHQFYIYALSGQASTIIPAKESMTIHITDAICWHPGDITNEDLFEMFKRDYKAKSGRDCDFSSDTYSSEFEYMLTNANSQWKWLGDFFNSVGAQRRKIPTNEELWGSDEGAISDGFKKYYNDKYVAAGNKPRSNMSIKDVATFLVSSDFTKKVLSESGSEYRWLYDYLVSVASSQSKTITQYWNYVLHGFFNKVKEGYVTNSQGDKIYYNIDFSSAGDPSHWRAAYLAGMKAQGVDVTINEKEPIDQASEWRVCAGTFFGQLPTETSQGFITTKIHNNRQYSAWKDEWIASFPSTTGDVKTKGLPSGIIRNNDIFAGWYYGNKCTSTSPGYDITRPVPEDNIAYDCVYARWLEPTLHEGYVTDEQMIAERRGVYNNFNLDLINLLAGQEAALQIDRKLQGGMYNTMCLPFAINGKTEFAAIKYADGSGKPFASVNDFSLVRYTGSTPQEEAMVLTFAELGDSDELPANTPFLLKPNNDITKLLQYGTAKTIEVVDHDPGQVVESDDEGDDGTGEGGVIIPQTPAEYALTVPDESISYTGVLAPTTLPEGSILLVADNRLATSTGGKMKAMRGFFSPLVLPIQQPMAIKITSRDGVTTYLDAAHTNNTSKIATKVLYNGKIYILRDGKVYTITGTRVK